MHEQHQKYSSNALDALGLEALNGAAYLPIALVDYFIDHLGINSIPVGAELAREGVRQFTHVGEAYDAFASKLGSYSAAIC